MIPRDGQKLTSQSRGKDVREEHQLDDMGRLCRDPKSGPGPDLAGPETKGAELYFGSKDGPLKGFKQTRDIIRFVAM